MHGGLALSGGRVGTNAEQAQRKRRDRTSTGRLTEVEDLRRVNADAALDGSIAYRIDQSRLANPRFTPDNDCATMPARHASIQRRENHRQFRTTTDEWLAGCATLGADGIQRPGIHRFGMRL